MTAVVRWTHPELGTITERPCDKHRTALLPALSLLGIVYGYTDDETPAECVRCSWDAPYGEQGLPLVHVRLRLEGLVVSEILADAR